jgi:mono/diheme cytochrome c family protein
VKRIPVLFFLLLSGACTKTVEVWEDVPDGSARRDGGQAGGDGGVVDTDPIKLLPDTMFSGFDGVHTFYVPVSVYNAKSPTLKASDPSMVTITPAKYARPDEDPGTWFLIKTAKAGKVTITASEGSRSTSVELNIASYTDAEFKAGETRYKTGSNGEPACAQCHAGAGGTDHSPTAMAPASDQDVVSVIKTGVLVAGNPIKVPHRWNVNEAEAKGLTVYLRALPPRDVTPVSR